MKTVAAAEWRATLQAAHDRGLLCLDVLTAVDRSTHLDVIAHVLDPLTGTGEDFCASVTDGVLDSIAAIFPAATWHEREAAEMFGLRFAGVADDRPLILRTSVTKPPMLKSVLLDERASTPWPGSAEPGGSPGRRRLLPPGVPDEGLTP
jgi:NADH-quinone oxidoreductase subunit C